MTNKKLTMTVTVAAAVGALAIGGAVAYAATTSTPTPTSATSHLAITAADAGDVKITKECVNGTPGVPDPASWRPGARIDTGSGDGFLVIRDNGAAAVCVIEKGHGAGIMGGDVSSNHVYRNLTAQRPFDYLTSMNYEKESIHFGIAADDVAGVALLGPDHSVTGGVVKDGTFIVKTKFVEDSNQSTTNHVRATLTNGQVVEGPFRR
jgi:hypothetical protein